MATRETSTRHVRDAADTLVEASARFRRNCFMARRRSASSRFCGGAVGILIVVEGAVRCRAAYRASATLKPCTATNTTRPLRWAKSPR